MILLFVIAAWIVLLALVGGLCAAARGGDRQLLTGIGDAGSGRQQASAMEAAEYLAVTAHAKVPPVRSADADVLVRSGSLAA